ncbi:MAG TPA: HD domain-containing phosphohydrolase [Pyrinomonadaceae bacterium]|nr:HD domain-containing phosphohydrolase [Pyrinomonadaceae bacterium]
MQPSTQKLIHSFAALADLGQEVANPGDFNDMVRTSLHLLLGTLAIRRGAVVECAGSDDDLGCVAVWGLGHNYEQSLRLDSPEREAFLNGHSLELGTEQHNHAFTGFLTRFGPKLRQQAIELVSPMVVQGKLTGLVLLGGKATGEPFSAGDLEVVRAMVRHIGVGINAHRLLVQVEQRAEENRRLYEDLRAIYRDTVRAFAAAIDIKDKYTQGHSERVGKYSEIIAREMGWDDEQAEGIAIAGYLHDIGKLVVERDIINAPYKIDAKSSNELNRHPVAGYEILAPIQHPYADIPLMARYHHERLDGRGYPDGLRGDQIPLGAKIVALADSFDAMTTDRPYRRRCAFPDVIQDFRRNTGSQFDPKVVAALCRALLKEIRGETRERRILKMLGKDYINSDQAIPALLELLAELDWEPHSVAAGGAQG